MIVALSVQREKARAEFSAWTRSMDHRQARAYILAGLPDRAAATMKRSVDDQARFEGIASTVATS
jgi:hypothetical protein